MRYQRIILLVAATAVLSPVAVGGAATSRTVTFHLVEKQTASNFIDNPPHQQGQHQPPSIGDQLVFTSSLATKSGGHAGTVSAACTIAQGGIHASGPCYGVFSFQGGQLMGIARLTFSNAPTEIVIVGGTGVYRGATGYITSVSRGENSPYSDDTVHIQLQK